MQISLNLIKKFVDLEQISLEKITKALDSIGTEVEDILDCKNLYENIIIAKITTANQHPNADKLKVCEVFTGTETLQIVCGAANARAGITVALARVGTIVPNSGLIIKSNPIRGVVSNGMLCSASELNLKDSSLDGGIIELESDLEAGRSFSEALFQDDIVISVKITPNRGDLISAYGLARELATFFSRPLNQLFNNSTLVPKEESSSRLSVKVDSSVMANYALIENSRCVQSPAWLRNILLIQNIKSINAIVDVTNYVSIVTGIPIHAYDKKKIFGAIEIRRAKSQEQALLLKDLNYQLDESMLVVADEKEVISLLGIMGGNNSRITEDTIEILLESSYSDPENFASTGQKLNIISDARFRSERGTDYSIIGDALKMAAELIIKIAGGHLQNFITAGTLQKKTKTIHYQISDFQKLIGINSSPAEMISILTRLGCKIAESGESLTITTPHHRHDLEIGADITEEIARFIGLDKIPEIAPVFATNAPNKTYNSILLCKKIASSRGYQEVYNLPFISEIHNKSFFDGEVVKLSNPINQNEDILSSSALPSLLLNIQYNQNKYNQESCSLFEVRKLFRGKQLHRQPTFCSGVRFGKVVLQDHVSISRDFSVLDIKKDILEIIAIISANKISPLDLIFEPLIKPYAHPFAAFSCFYDGEEIATFGALHPEMLKKDFDILNGGYFFEINLEALWLLAQNYANKKTVHANKTYNISKELSLILSKDCNIESILKEIDNIWPEVISEVALIEKYQGKIAKSDFILLVNNKEMSEKILQNNSLYQFENLNLRSQADVIANVDKISEKISLQEIGLQSVMIKIFFACEAGIPSEKLQEIFLQAEKLVQDHGGILRGVLN